MVVLGFSSIRQACFILMSRMNSNGVCPTTAFILRDNVARDTFKLPASWDTSNPGLSRFSSTIRRALEMSCSSNEENSS